MFSKKTVNYVSEIDKFLENFIKTHEPTPSQQAEIKKYQKIDELRDKAQLEAKEQKS